MTSPADVDSLFVHAMKGEWRTVSEICAKSRDACKAKLTKSEDTALHIAVSVGQTETALELVNISSDRPDILSTANVKGDTALHVAAALGNLRVCEAMCSKNHHLITTRNLKGETPLFLASRHGKRDSFLFLYSLGKEDYHVRRNDGDTILHAAISGEYFRLALSIIHSHPKLADAINENGLTPLHILANKPNAFKSSCHLGLYDRIIYHCLVVDDLEEQDDIEAHIRKRSKKLVNEVHNYPQNYKTIAAFFRMMSFLFRFLFVSSLGLKHSVSGEAPNKERKKETGKTIDEENLQLKSISVQEKGKQAQAQNKTSNIEETPQKSNNISQGKNHFERQRHQDHDFPPNYNTLVMFVKLMIKAFLIILGIGILRIDKIRRKKKLHMWAKLVMDELVMNTTSYKFYDNTGLDPYQTQAGNIEEILSGFHGPSRSESSSAKNILTTNPSFKEEHQSKRDQNESGINKQQTPILIAAKMGVTEMVEKILEEFPVAIQDLDSDGKNILLLAVENRHPQIYNFLLHSKILKETVFRQLDFHGNSALHLAAHCKENRPWLIPGVALQMQWEIKWYKFVKSSMPPQFFPRYNANNETPKDIFVRTHKTLVKEGAKWLMTTSESCSVVAALVAAMAFATSATVPGGLDQTTGAPILSERPAFKGFVVSSLAALCFSVTALVFFLSILTSRCQEKDFGLDLPRKLLLGLTSLFASIAAILVSFCEGHVFILPNNLRFVAYPLYAALCFPISYFALAQLSLYFDLACSIFKRVPQRSS